MEEVALIVLGAIVGVVSTGGVGVWDAWRRRRTRRRVAARLLLGDLYVLESMTGFARGRRQWPDFYDYEQQLQTWREVRADLAEGTNAVEWAAVDRAYAHLHRTAQIARPGEVTSEGHLAVLTELCERTLKARDALFQHIGSQRELKRLVAELGSASPVTGAEAEPEGA